MKRIVWVYWENRHGQREPAYITLCRWTMLYRLKSAVLVIVTPENMDKYIPGLSDRTKDIQVDIRGRADRALRKFGKPSRKNVAVKCDVIRASLLQRYGGIYIDADTVLLDDLAYYFELFDQYEMICTKRSSHGKRHNSVGFYGARANTGVINQYVERQRAILQNSRELHYNELGASLITEIIRENQASVYNIPEKEIQPIPFEEARSRFTDTGLKPDEIVANNQRVFMLFNGPFENELKNLDIEAIYKSDMLVSKVFRKALPEDVFEQWFSSR